MDRTATDSPGSDRNGEAARGTADEERTDTDRLGRVRDGKAALSVHQQPAEVMDVKYMLKDGAPIDGDPEVIGQALRRIQEEDGNITPEGVLKRARKESHPLHEYFTWDNDEAARKQRRREARRISRSVIIREIDGKDVSDEPVRAFVNVEDEEHGRGYEATEKALTSERKRDQILEDAERDLRHVRRKYSHLREFTKIVDSALSKLQEA